MTEMPQRKFVTENYRVQDFEKLLNMIDNHELMRTPMQEQLDVQKLRSAEYRAKCVMRASLDDVALGINLCKIQLGEAGTAAADFGIEAQPKSAKIPNPYIKIMLQKTPVIVLYQQRSITVLRDTDEGRQVELDNAKYEELLASTDKARRTVCAETQTLSALKKSRLVNTERLATDNVGSYVSNFEMFDTYKDLEKSTQSVEVEGKQKMQITTYKVGGVDQFVAINSMPSFKLALMLTMRILAGNVFEAEQRRFRNMSMPDPLAEDVKFKYNLRLLWCLAAPQAQHDERMGKDIKAVTDISFCPNNGDILAVADGVYTYTNVTLNGIPNNGHVYIWNIKNPVNPERCYDYKVPVITVEFSPYSPQLLAVGLYNGSIQVLDIAQAEQPPVAVSQRTTSPSYELVTAIKWIAQSDGDIGGRDIEPFLALFQDGSITKFRIINSPNLLGYQQNQLQRVEGALEGIEVSQVTIPLQANRHPQGLALTLDPTEPDVYFVLTDEGTMYKCSTNYPQQHLALRQVHETAAVGMEYSPWSPKMYLTCGSDWCIRIWLVGILQPLLTLRHHLLPVQCAHWSRTHSTILVSLSRTTVDIWDLRNSTLRPVSSTTIDAKIHYTTFEFSHCGRSLAIGNEAGHLLMLAFEDMPFPPHFQYKQLKRAIYRALATEPEMKRLVKSLGYFGYPQSEKCK